MTEEYYKDEDGVLRGNCDRHGAFVGDAIGCPECFREQEECAMMEEQPFEGCDEADDDP